MTICGNRLNAVPYLGNQRFFICRAKIIMQIKSGLKPRLHLVCDPLITSNSVMPAMVLKSCLLDK